MRVECSHCRKISSIGTRAMLSYNTEACDLSRLEVVLRLPVTHHEVEKHYMYDNSACTQVSSFHPRQSAPGTGLESRGMNFVSFIVKHVTQLQTIFVSGQLKSRELFSRPEGVRFRELRLYHQKLEPPKFQSSLIVFLCIRTKT